MSARTTLVALSAALVTSPLLMAPAVDSGGGDATIRRGSCSGHAEWRLKVKPDDGRIELEAEVDSNRSGQVWRWRLAHDGTRSASGRETTAGLSGSFEVRRRMSDLSGSDAFTFRAVRRATGEVCRGTIVL